MAIEINQLHVKSLRCLSYLHANKLACLSFIDAVRRHRIHGLKTKDSLLLPEVA